MKFKSVKMYCNKINPCNIKGQVEEITIKKNIFFFYKYYAVCGCMTVRELQH